MAVQFSVESFGISGGKVERPIGLQVLVRQETFWSHYHVSVFHILVKTFNKFSRNLEKLFFSFLVF
jgi:hypothetical protein